REEGQTADAPICPEQRELPREGSAMRRILFAPAPRCVLAAAALVLLPLLAPPARATPGSKDATFAAWNFSSGGVDVSGAIVASAVQPDDKIVLAGASSDYRMIVARLNWDGTPDPTFGNYGSEVITDPMGFTPTPKSVAIQPDGKIVVAGSFDSNHSDFMI